MASSGQSERDQRRAEALRQNLGRRKAQARARAETVEKLSRALAERDGAFPVALLALTDELHLATAEDLRSQFAAMQSQAREFGNLTQSAMQQGAENAKQAMQQGAEHARNAMQQGADAARNTANNATNAAKDAAS